MTGREQEQDQDWCECEHESHFDTSKDVHTYGAHVEATEIVKTIFGGFRVCITCRQTCWAPGGEGADYLTPEKAQAINERAQAICDAADEQGIELHPEEML